MIHPTYGHLGADLGLDDPIQRLCFFHAHLAASARHVLE